MTTSPAGSATTGRPLNINPSDIDLSEVQAEFEDRLDRLMSDWGGLTQRQIDRIVDQVRVAVTANDLAAIAAISVNTSDAAELLAEHMMGMALEAAKRMSREAREQGVRIDPVASDGERFTASAVAMAALLGAAMANSAGREALRQWSVTTSGDDVAANVRQHLEELSDAFPKSNLGALLTSAQNTGRLNTILSGPSVAIYANEVMDRNTCSPCREVDGKWLGNSDDPGTPARVAEVYPNGGYRFCEGGVRCRGTIVSVYRPEQVNGDN